MAGEEALPLKPVRQRLKPGDQIKDLVLGHQGCDHEIIEVQAHHATPVPNNLGFDLLGDAVEMNHVCHAARVADSKSHVKQRPFPSDPQWLQLSRKLPPDAVIECLLRFGFRTNDIAERFDVTPSRVSAAARRAGLKPIPNGSTMYRPNGAPIPRRDRIAPVLCSYHTKTPRCALPETPQPERVMISAGGDISCLEISGRGRRKYPPTLHSGRFLAGRPL